MRTSQNLFFESADLWSTSSRTCDPWEALYAILVRNIWKIPLFSPNFSLSCTILTISFFHSFSFLTKLSQTQTLITQISRLCQEIRDIKRQNKNQSISTPKAEPRKGETLNTIQEKTMDSNQCQDHTSIDGTDGSGCTYSSCSILPPHSEHSCDIPSRHGTSHPFLCSTPTRSNQEQPAAQSPSPPDNTQLSTSSSPAGSYPKAPSSVSETLIGIVAGNKQDQNPQKGGRLSSESESDSDCESRVGMEEEGKGGLVCGGGTGLGDKHWAGVWYEEVESTPFLASVPQEHWVSGKEWRYWIRGSQWSAMKCLKLSLRFCNSTNSSLRQAISQSMSLMRSSWFPTMSLMKPISGMEVNTREGWGRFNSA